MPIDDGKPIQRSGGNTTNIPSALNSENSQNAKTFVPLFDFSGLDNDSIANWNTYPKNNSIKVSKNEPLPFPKGNVDVQGGNLTWTPVSTRVQRPHELMFIKKAPDLKTVYTPNFDVTKELFNGTAEDLNKCLENTKLKGMGQTFIDTQYKYNINALFLMSVTKVESGYGSKPKKSCKYNIVGSVGQHPKSYEESVDSLGRNLSKNYIPSGNVTLNKIRDKYCKTNKVWPKNVAQEMNNLSNKIKSQYL